MLQKTNQHKQIVILMDAINKLEYERKMAINYVIAIDERIRQIRTQIGGQVNGK